MPRPSSCHDGEQAAVIDSLYFGTAKADGEVTAGEWQRFLAEEITPRFPEGLTSWAAAGQWRDGSGRLWKEGSYVLSLVHPPSERSETAIREIVAIYKSRFQQEAVLRVRSPACMSF